LRSRKGKTLRFSDDERANLLNDYFGPVCAPDSGIIPAMERFVPDYASINTVDFSPARVFAALKTLKNTNSCGPDNFPPMLCKKLAPVLAELFSLMLTSFMSVGQMPKTIVTPVYKSGDESDVSIITGLYPLFVSRAKLCSASLYRTCLIISVC
jgi:hypothetical protein